MNGGLWIAFWLLLNLGAVGVYDVLAYWFLPPDESVSFWLQKWLQNWPMAGIFIGIVIGHLGWPLNRGGEALVHK